MIYNDKGCEKWIFTQPLRTVSLEAACNLLREAEEVMTKSYSPYSKFRVGSAVLTSDGSIYVGTNIENASFGATICAERVAIFNAITNGCKEMKAIAVIADSPEPVPPCGICRQVISEFSSSAIILMANTTGRVNVTTIGDMLPGKFELK